MKERRGRARPRLRSGLTPGQARAISRRRPGVPGPVPEEGMGGMSQTTRTFGRCLLLVLAVLPVVPGSGCQSMSNTDKGVLAGGGLGAATGALIGGSRGHAGTGAVAGGVLGAVAGGLTGAAIDNS